MTKTFQISQFLLAVLFIFAAGNAQAGGVVKINNYLNTNNSVISIINPTGLNAKLKIYDESDNLVFSKNISSDASIQEIVNFKDATNGKYKIIVANKLFKSEDFFSLVNNKISKSYKRFNTKEKVFFRVNKNMLYVSRSVMDANFTVAITDKAGNTFFNETYKKSTTSKKFNINNLPTGTYDVKLFSGNKEFIYAFKK